MSDLRSSVIACVVALWLAAPAGAATHPPSQAQMDKDLLEVSIPQLQRYYARHTYTVVQVVQWYLDRRDWWEPLRARYAGERLGLAAPAPRAKTPA